MGAKRAVAGRSLPYDMLLAAYQKKNQAKQQSESLRLFRSGALPFLMSYQLLTTFFCFTFRGRFRCECAYRGRGRCQQRAS